MGSDNRRIDHGIFIVAVTGQGFEKILPNTIFRPTREATVGVFPIAKALRQIAPRRTRPELPNHRLNKQPVAAFAGAANMARSARKQIFYPRKLIIAQPLAFHHQSLREEGSSESRFR